ncbi:calcium-binding protein [Hahella ganghwensis]|uniref:calcium-binding protein n=1 Tax=Hahella ganghwensis TaxID=286420 RepID=UPI0003782317|nr:calcium-binding protein [Hahella ganghwensis]
MIGIADIYLGRGDDTFIGSSGNDIVDGGEGDDHLEGKAGDDTFVYTTSTSQDGDFYDGGSGFDTLMGSALDDELTLNRVTNDETSLLVSVERIDGGSGDNSIVGSNDHRRPDFIDLRSIEVINISRIDLRHGEDVLYGTPQADIIIGGTADDQLYGMEGNDIFLTEGSNQGADAYIGGEGFDTLQGGDGNDEFTFAIPVNEDMKTVLDVEKIDGGAGENWILGSNSAYDKDYIDLRQVEVINIAGIDLRHGNDVFYGTSGPDLIIGGTADDKLYGEQGDDTFLTEGENQGEDIYIGGEGFDTLLGGDGNDYFSFARPTDDNMKTVLDVERIDGGAGDNWVQGSDKGYDRDFIDLRGIEVINVIGIDLMNGHDVAYGSDASETLIGGLGDDELYGMDGGDTYVFAADEGEDVVTETGTSGVDILSFPAISKNSLWFDVSGDDLKIFMIGSSGMVVSVR